MEKIIVIGGGGHAKSVISVIKKMGRFQILGYIDLSDKGPILGVGYLGDDRQLASIKNRYPDCQAAIGIGYVELSSKREGIQQQLSALGFELPVLISPTAVINEDVRIGRGTVIHDGVIINVDSVIGECVILNTKSSIDHDCRIGNFVHIAPGATLNGGVIIGKNSIIGTGSTIIQYKSVCDNCVIGAGAIVVEDCQNSGIYLGIPAEMK